MSFRDIQLPQAVIAEIYASTLVDITQKKSDPIQYLGKNVQKILIFVNYADEVYLPEGQLEFLEKILLACKLNIGDIAIVNVARQPRHFDDYITTFGPKSILVFGPCVPVFEDNKETSFFIPVYQQDNLLMSAPALEKLNEESIEGKQLKAKFWHSLKPFFGI